MTTPLVNATKHEGVMVLELSKPPANTYSYDMMALDLAGGGGRAILQPTGRRQYARLSGMPQSHGAWRQRAPGFFR